MSVILVYSAGCGAEVNFHDDSYIRLSETELEYRRENMIRTAEQIAQEHDLKRIGQIKRSESAENT